MAYDLPHEADLTLGWSDAIGFLERLLGEEVVVWMGIGAGHDQLMSGGVLRRLDAPAAYAFSVGTAAVTLPGASAFSSGSLSTVDGADYFTLRFTFGDHTVFVGQPDLHGSDYQEAVWARYAEADQTP